MSSFRFWSSSSSVLLLAFVAAFGVCGAFVLPTTSTCSRSSSTSTGTRNPNPLLDRRVPKPTSPSPTTTTSLNYDNEFNFLASNYHALLPVPRHFFAVTLFGYGIILQFSKAFGRNRMEERAWEQRLEEGRRKRLAEDPTLTELDLRRAEAELEWSAYGKPRLEEKMRNEKQRQREQEREREESRDSSNSSSGKHNRVRVMDREEEEDEEDDLPNRMTDKEIDRFEMEFGIDYDPYYDDPYTEDELPEGKYIADKRYGDRVYDNGEIFYKDVQTNLYYRQGAKPRSTNFFG